MQQIDIANIPNQSFSASLDGNTFDFTIKETNGVMAMDLIINNITVLLGARLVSGAWIIPYAYLENGNFLISTLNDDYPYYTEFGISQFLLYASPTELMALRATNDN
jgi:hypothetical protein